MALRPGTEQAGLAVEGDKNLPPAHSRLARALPLERARRVIVECFDNLPCVLSLPERRTPASISICRTVNSEGLNSLHPIGIPIRSCVGRRAHTICLIKLGHRRRLKSGFALYRSAGPAVLQRRVWHHRLEPAPILAHAGCIAISHVHSKHIIALGRTSRCRVCLSLVRAAMRLSSRTSFQHLL